MNKQIKEVPYFFAMTLFMDMTKFYAVFDTNEQVIRLVGDNKDDECPEWK